MSTGVAAPATEVMTRILPSDWTATSSEGGPTEPSNRAESLKLGKATDPLPPPKEAPVVRLRHIEVVHRVPERVDIGKYLGGRVQVELEADQALAALGRLHPQLHDAFAHRLGVVVLGDVADLEKHGDP